MKALAWAIWIIVIFGPPIIIGWLGYLWGGWLTAFSMLVAYVVAAFVALMWPQRHRP